MKKQYDAEWQAQQFAALDQSTADAVLLGWVRNGLWTSHKKRHEILVVPRYAAAFAASLHRSIAALEALDPATRPEDTEDVLEDMREVLPLVERAAAEYAAARS